MVFAHKGGREVPGRLWAGAAMESVDADEHFELLGQFALGHKLTPSVEILAVDYVFASRSVKLAEHEFNRINTSDAVEGIRGIAVWRIPVKGPGAVMSFRVIAKSIISNGSEDLVVGCRTFSFDGEVWKEIDGQSALPIKSMREIDER